MDFYTSIESKKKNEYMSIYKFNSYLLEVIIRSESTAKRIYFACFSMLSVNSDDVQSSHKKNRARRVKLYGPSAVQSV